MKAMITMRCVLCGKTFRPGNTDGMPNGFGFQMQSGSIYNICAECVACRYEEAIALIQSAEADAALDCTEHNVSGLLDD